MSSKKSAVITLGLLALVCSKVFFWLIDDPEGANLLIVLVVALFLFLASLFAYRFTQLTHAQRWFLAVLIQILLTILLRLAASL